MHHEFMLARVLISLAMLPDKVGTLHKHATRAAGRVEYEAAVWLNHLNHQPYHAGGRKELSTTLAFLQREFTEEVFIHLAKDIARDVGRNVADVLQQSLGKRTVIVAITIGRNQFHILIFGERAYQFRLVVLYALHGLFDGLGYVGRLREAEQIVEMCIIRQVVAHLRQCYVLYPLCVASTLRLLVFSLNLSLVSVVLDRHEAQED